MQPVDRAVLATGFVKSVVKSGSMICPMDVPHDAMTLLCVSL